MLSLVKAGIFILIHSSFRDLFRAKSTSWDENFCKIVNGFSQEAQYFIFECVLNKPVWVFIIECYPCCMGDGVDTDE